MRKKLQALADYGLNPFIQFGTQKPGGKWYCFISITYPERGKYGMPMREKDCFKARSLKKLSKKVERHLVKAKKGFLADLEKEE